MDEINSIVLLKEFGFTGIVTFLWFILVKQQQKKMFEQSDEVVNFATSIVSQNIIALTQMNESLKTHMEQKDKWMEHMKDCAQERNERLRNIEIELRAGFERVK